MVSVALSIILIKISPLILIQSINNCFPIALHPWYYGLCRQTRKQKIVIIFFLNQKIILFFTCKLINWSPLFVVIWYTLKYTYLTFNLTHYWLILGTKIIKGKSFLINKKIKNLCHRIYLYKKSFLGLILRYG